MIIFLYCAVLYNVQCAFIVHVILMFGIPVLYNFGQSTVCLYCRVLYNTYCTCYFNLDSSIYLCCTLCLMCDMGPSLY